MPNGDPSLLWNSNHGKLSPSHNACYIVKDRLYLRHRHIKGYRYPTQPILTAFFTASVIAFLIIYLEVTRLLLPSHGGITNSRHLRHITQGFANDVPVQGKLSYDQLPPYIAHYKRQSNNSPKIKAVNKNKTEIPTKSETSTTRTEPKLIKVKTAETTTQLLGTATKSATKSEKTATKLLEILSTTETKPTKPNSPTKTKKEITKTQESDIIETLDEISETKTEITEEKAEIADKYTEISEGKVEISEKHADITAIKAAAEVPVYDGFLISYSSCGSETIVRLLSSLPGVTFHSSSPRDILSKHGNQSSSVFSSKSKTTFAVPPHHVNILHVTLGLEDSLESIQQTLSRQHHNANIVIVVCNPVIRWMTSVMTSLIVNTTNHNGTSSLRQDYSKLGLNELYGYYTNVILTNSNEHAEKTTNKSFNAAKSFAYEKIISSYLNGLSLNKSSGLKLNTKKQQENEKLMEKRIIVKKLSSATSTLGLQKNNKPTDNISESNIKTKANKIIKSENIISQKVGNNIDIKVTKPHNIIKLQSSNHNPKNFSSTKYIDQMISYLKSKFQFEINLQKTTELTRNDRISNEASTNVSCFQRYLINYKSDFLYINQSKYNFSKERVNSMESGNFLLDTENAILRLKKIFNIKNTDTTKTVFINNLLFESPSTNRNNMTTDLKSDSLLMFLKSKLFYEILNITEAEFESHSEHIESLYTKIIEF